MNEELKKVFNLYSEYHLQNDDLCDPEKCNSCEMQPLCNNAEIVTALLLAEILSELKKQNAEMLKILKSIDNKMIQNETD